MFSIFPGRWRAELKEEREQVRALIGQMQRFLDEVTGPHSKTTLPRELVVHSQSVLLAATHGTHLPEEKEALAVMRLSRSKLMEVHGALAKAAFENSTQPVVQVPGPSWEHAAQQFVDQVMKGQRPN